MNKSHSVIKHLLVFIITLFIMVLHFVPPVVIVRYGACNEWTLLYILCAALDVLWGYIIVQLYL